jgi:hypothetical protein
VRIEQSWLSAMVISAVVTMATEVYYLHGESSVFVMQVHLQYFVENVAGLIDAASAEPEFNKIK